MCNQPPNPARIPKDGPGPRGGPDCYYMSRQLNSTFRYANFVKKLRADEDKERVEKKMRLQESQDMWRRELFKSSDRKRLLQDISKRVDLCLAAYEQDLEAKRQRLRDLYTKEEEENMKKFVKQAQEGTELVWQDKINRLEYLLAKRKKEQDEKCKDTPLSKCAHVLPEIYKMRCKEAQEIQLYQMKEKEMKKMAEKELEKMWHEVALKESDALTVRMEQDAIEKARRNDDCLRYISYQVELKKQEKDQNMGMLKQQLARLKAVWDEDARKEDEKQRLKKEEFKTMLHERDQLLKKDREDLAHHKEEDVKIGKIWESLTSQRLGDEMKKAQMRRDKERELNECNRRLLELKHEYEGLLQASERARREVFAERQAKLDDRYYERKRQREKLTAEVYAGQKKQTEDRIERENLLNKLLEEEEHRRLKIQADLAEMERRKECRQTESKRRNHQNLLKQIEYNTLLAERTKKEQQEEIVKCKKATEEYQKEIDKMLARPFFSDHQHAFMKQMTVGLTAQEKCPCSKSDYCK